MALGNLGCAKVFPTKRLVRSRRRRHSLVANFLVITNNPNRRGRQRFVKL